MEESGRRVATTLSDEAHDRLTLFLAATGKNKTDAIREAIEQYLTSHSETINDYLERQWKAIRNEETRDKSLSA